jgi:hypothetical protein
MSSSLTRSGLLLLALFLGLLSAPGAAAPPHRPSSPVVIPLEPYIDQDHYAFRASIGGQEGLFQFDTGGGLTVLTPQSASAAGCKQWSRLTGFRMRGDRIDVPRCDNVDIVVGSARLLLPTTGVWDLSAVLPAGAPPLGGSVGLDAFSGQAITVDLSHRRLVIETPTSLKARVAHSREIPIHVVREAEGYALTVMLGVETGSGRLWFTLDSGNDAGLTIGRHVATLLGLDPQLSAAQPVELQLAGGVPLKGEAHSRELILDGNIGSPVIRHWLVTIDLAHQRLWLAELP